MTTAKVYVVYDDRGRIRGTAVPAQPNSRVVAGFGMRVHAIEHPGLART